MPRPKGSKNRKSTEFVDTVENIDEKIAATESAKSNRSPLTPKYMPNITFSLNK
jgi:hypothetical protein